MLAKRRIITGTTMPLRTPMLVPSFSSKSDTDWKPVDQIQLLSEHLTEAALVSAYDLHHGLATVPVGPEILFIDSGGYEVLRDFKAAENGDSSGLTRFPWTEQLHRTLVGSLKLPRGVKALVAVSYDHPNTPKQISEQITAARELAEANPQFLVEILLKPPPNERVHDIENILPHIEELRPFSVIGVTDKELGPSMLHRMAAVARLRRALNEKGIDTPIHVFGSLDPVTTPLYFLAGADIFDGLSWLRYGMKEGRTTYLQNHAAWEFGLKATPESVQSGTWVNNYLYMRKLQEQMECFLKEGNFEEFENTGSLLKHAHTVLTVELGE